MEEKAPGRGNGGPLPTGRVDDAPVGDRDVPMAASEAQDRANGGHQGNGNHAPSGGKQENSDASPQPPQEDDEDNKDDHRHNPLWHPHPSLHKPLEWLQKCLPMPLNLVWLKPHLNWRGAKPVIRSSVCGFVNCVLLVDDRVLKAFGNAAFLVLVSAGVTPPSESIGIVTERTFVMAFMICVAWAFAAVGIRIAWISRHEFKFHSAAQMAEYVVQQHPEVMSDPDPSNAISNAIVNDAVFIEWRSSLVCAIFLAVGGALCMYTKSAFGPGPWVMGSVFASILLCIALTVAPFYPLPEYTLGEVFVYPFFSAQAVGLVCAYVVLPETLHHSFCQRMIGALAPVRAVIFEQKKMLQTPPSSPKWRDFDSFNQKVTACFSGLAMLGAVKSSLRREISIRRYAAEDLEQLWRLSRKLGVRLSGFAYFQKLVASHLAQQTVSKDGKTTIDDFQLHVGRPGPGFETGANTPVGRQSLDEKRATPDQGPPRDGLVSSASSTNGSHPHSPSHPGDVSKGDRKRDLLHSVFATPKLPELAPVGQHELDVYARLNDDLANPLDRESIERIIGILSTATGDLLTSLEGAIVQVIDFMGRVASAGIWESRQSRKADWTERLQATLDDLTHHREVFIKEKRFQVTAPFASMLDEDDGQQHPSPHGLYWTYLYMNTLIAFTETVQDILRAAVAIEQKRRRLRLRGPTFVFHKGPVDTADPSADVDPETIPGFEAMRSASAKRNPDRYPPRTTLQIFCNRFSSVIAVANHPSMIFFLKSAAIIGIASIPLFYRSTAAFGFNQKGIWLVIMVVLASSQFVGDTTFAFVNRILGSILGAILGLVMWYTGNGSGHGSPYGFCAVAAVVFPILFYCRLYYAALMPALIGTVTCMLVIGYSWQDGHKESGTGVGIGWTVTWKRLVGVMAGVFAAWVWSLLPPRSLAKNSFRMAYGKILQRQGELLAGIISHHSRKGAPRKPHPRAIGNILALRHKLIHIGIRKIFIGYEISLRGTWPAKEYATVHNLTIELIEGITNFMGAIAFLDDRWVAAVMQRARFTDPEFLGQMLTTFQLLSTALKTGDSLPYVYTPLVDQLLRPRLGLQVTRRDDLGLPTHVTMDTISSLEYIHFATAITYAYSIASRLDRLVFAVKSLVGESYLVWGLDQEEELRPLCRHDDNA